MIHDSRERSAFTLLEALTVLGVGAAVLILIIGMGVTWNKRFRTAVAQRDAATIADRALDRLTRDVRSARLGEDGGHPLRIAGDQEIVFTSDVDGDGAAEWIRYTLAEPNAPTGGWLERSVAEPSGTPPRYDPATATTEVIARGIRNGERPVFAYYRVDYPTRPEGNPLPAPVRLSETRHVRVELAINLDPPATPTTTVTTAATFRNLWEGQ